MCQAAFTDYGLRVLMRLADAPERRLTTGALAAELRLPYNHLAKAVQELARACSVTTQRGAHGGIRLACPPETVMLGELVRLLKQHHAVVECFRADGGACLLTPNCRFRGRLAIARDAFIASLDQSRLADCTVAAPAPDPSARPADGGRDRD